MTHDPTLRALVRALQPIVSRVRTDVSARKGTAGSYWTDEPLTEDRLLHHVNGGPARGACPIKEGESVTMLAVLDFDSHRGESSWEQMVECALSVQQLLEAMGHAPIAFRSSGGRGIHLILLWDRPQDAYSVRQMLTEALGLLGLKNGAKGVVHGQVEVFPKQDAVGQGEMGNQFILPLAGKSEPLVFDDLLCTLVAAGREHALQMAWPTCPDVPVLQRPERAVAAAGSADPIEKVRAALFSLVNDGSAASPDYERWFALACATHEATAGSEEGREVFVEWSAQNPIFDQPFFDKRIWPYIKPADGRTTGRTRATLYGAASSAGWAWGGAIDADGFEDVAVEDSAAELAAVQARDKAASDERRQLVSRERFEDKERWKKAILDAPDELSLREQVCQRIVLDKMLSDIDREMLADTLKTRLAALGSKLPIAACRKMLAPVRERASDAEAPEWTEGWVYVTDNDEFFRLDSDESLSMQSFNARFNRMLPPVEDGVYRKTASWVALEDAQIETVTRGVYLPWAQPTFEMDGVRCVNTYRPSTTPKAVSALSPAGRAARDLVLRHLSLIAGGRQPVVDMLVSWMAFNVQNPGVKIRWAPLIKGIPGDGKSVIGDLMAAVMGHPNVNIIGPAVLGTQFSDWAHKACVGVLEEIRLTGHSRYDVENALKPFISNGKVQIHPKGSAPFNTINTVNYIAFTNHSDALPLTDTDRRWWIIFTAFLSIEEMQGAVGEVGAYFDALFDAISTRAAELRRWLLDVQIDESFKPNGRAPMSEEKGSMIAMSISEEEDAVAQALSAGGVGIGKQVVSSSALSEAVNKMDSDVLIQTTKLANVMGKLGWMKYPKVIKWAGKAHRVWVKGLLGAENEAIRAALDETLVTRGVEGENEDLFA